MPAILAMISIGGACGALARYGLTVVIPNAGGFPWATLIVNLLGCLLIGVLTGWLESRTAHRLVRPALGVGVLGGFTTFSTYAVETVDLLSHNRFVPAAAYALVTLAGSLTAAYLGVRLTRRTLRIAPAPAPVPAPQAEEA